MSMSTVLPSVLHVPGEPQATPESSNVPMEAPKRLVKDSASQQKGS